MSGDGRRVGSIIGIIGAGRLGSALALALYAAGWRVGGVASRTAASADRLAALVGAPAMDAAGVARACDIVFLTVPDAAIAGVAEGLCAALDAGAPPASPAPLAGRCFYHACGAMDASAIAPLRRLGAAVGSLHPLQSFADRDSWRNLEGCYVALEGDAPAVERGLEAAQAFGGRPFALPAGGKVLYHAAAAIASNYLIAVETLARDAMAAAGVEPARGLEILRPLIEGTLRNAFAVGVPKALTGPISRGDVAVVQAHRDAMARAMPAQLPAWGALGELTAECALRNGTISDDVARRLGEVFDACRPGKGGGAG